MSRPTLLLVSFVNHMFLSGPMAISRGPIVPVMPDLNWLMGPSPGMT